MIRFWQNNIISVFISVLFLLILSALYLFWGEWNWTSDSCQIIVELRLPRLLALVLVGIGLSFSGYVFQIIFNNTLAEPYLLGTSLSASLGTIVGLQFVSFLGLGFWWISLFQIVGAVFLALVSTFFILYLAGKYSQSYSNKLLLLGVAISSLSSACISFLLISSSAMDTKMLLYKITGGFESIYFFQVGILLFVLLIYLFFIVLNFRKLSVMVLGEEQVMAMNINVIEFKRNLIILNTILVAILVYVSGPIGFVGLVIPHMSRLLFRNKTMFYQLISLFFLGPTLLIICDLISKNLNFYTFFPIGVITSLLGAPFFLHLVYKGRT